MLLTRHRQPKKFNQECTKKNKIAIRRDQVDREMNPKNSKKKDGDNTRNIDTNLIYALALLLTQNDPVNSEHTVQHILTEIFSSPLSFLVLS